MHNSLVAGAFFPALSRLLRLSFLPGSGVFLLLSCGSIQPEVPEMLVTSVTPPEQEVSVIKVPIKINLKPYFKEADAAVPKEFTGKEQTCEGVSYSYKFKREPIQFEGKGNVLRFDVDGKYSLNLNYCPKCSDLFSSTPNCLSPRVYASCGVDEPMRKIHVGYHTEIGITSGYRLKSTTELRTVKAVTPCEITVFKYDATGELEEELRSALKAVEKDIDKEIGTIDLKPDMEATWKLLQDPTDLEGYGFLYLHPSAISMSKIRYSGDTAYFNAILEARPSVSLTREELRYIPLPRLKEYEDRNGFDITADIFAGYDSLSTLLTRNIKGTKVDLNGKEIIFGDISVFGAYNNSIHLKVSFSGARKGTLFLTGTPQFNADRQFLSFPDLTFDLKTKSALLKSAKWLFNGKITDALRSSAAIDLRPYLDSLKITLNESLNTELSDGVMMKGSVRKLDIRFIHPQEYQIHLRVHSTGKLEIIM